MMIRVIGGSLIILGCAGFGFAKARNYRKEERYLRQIFQAIEYMECELQFRLPSLPDLIISAGEQAGGEIKDILLRYSDELKMQRYSNPGSCMDKLLCEFQHLPNSVLHILRQLGKSVGMFDLEGQLKGLRYVKAQCSDMLIKLTSNADVRIRNYQTLGLCAGIALAILLI